MLTDFAEFTKRYGQTCEQPHMQQAASEQAPVPPALPDQGLKDRISGLEKENMQLKKVVNMFEAEKSSQSPHMQQTAAEQAPPPPASPNPGLKSRLNGLEKENAQLREAAKTFQARKNSQSALLVDFLVQNWEAGLYGRSRIAQLEFLTRLGKVVDSGVLGPRAIELAAHVRGLREGVLRVEHNARLRIATRKLAGILENQAQAKR